MTSKALSREEIVEVARREVAAIEPKFAADVFEAVESEQGWTVIAWTLPKGPGGFRAVLISPDGHVKNYHRGL